MSKTCEAKTRKSQLQPSTQAFSARSHDLARNFRDVTEWHHSQPRSQGLSSLPQGRQRRETLGTRLHHSVKSRHFAPIRVEWAGGKRLGTRLSRLDCEQSLATRVVRVVSNATRSVSPHMRHFSTDAAGVFVSLDYPWAVEKESGRSWSKRWSELTRIQARLKHTKISGRSQSKSLTIPRGEGGSNIKGPFIFAWVGGSLVEFRGGPWEKKDLNGDLSRKNSVMGGHLNK